MRQAGTWFRAGFVGVLIVAVGCGLDDDDDDVPDVPQDADGAVDADDDAADGGETTPRCGDGVIDDGEDCDDGNTTDGDGCEDDCRFSCADDTDCGDGDPCTADVCAEVARGRSCTHEPDVGAACDDGDECTEGETCDASGDCDGGTYVCQCDPLAADTCEDDHGDGDPCNGVLVCDAPTASCVVLGATVLAPGWACDDGLFCNGGDTCQGDPPACTHAGDPCASCQSCDEAGDACPTGSDACFIDATCYVDGEPDPEDACRACSPATSQTDWTPAAEGTACDDGLFCNGVDTCQGDPPACTHAGDPCEPATCLGTCLEEPRGCTNVMACYIDGVCYRRGELNPDNACEGCSGMTSPRAWRAFVDGAPCDDGIFCNGTDSCSGGTCSVHSGDPCARIFCLGTCDATTESCTVGTGCYIGSMCIPEGEQNYLNACQVCDSSVSATSWTDRADGDPCDDRDPCSMDDACTAGTCSGTVGSCTTSPVIAGGHVRLCITSAACDALGEGTCTEVSAPASWTLIPWMPMENRMVQCTTASEPFWMVDVGALPSGTYCYRFNPNLSATWYNDPLNPDSGPGRCGGDNSRFVIP